MDVDAAFPSGAEPAELMQPGEGALDRPELAAQAGAVGFLTAGDDRGDPAGGERTPVREEVVGPVGEEVAGAAAWSSSAAADRGDRFDEPDELGDVVAVPASHEGGERNPAGVGDQVVFTAGVGPVDRARTRLGAPFSAWRARSRSAPGADRAAQ